MTIVFYQRFAVFGGDCPVTKWKIRDVVMCDAESDENLHDKVILGGNGGRDLLATGKTPEIACEIMDEKEVSAGCGGRLDGSAKPVLPLKLPLAINRSNGCVVVAEKGMITSNQWS